MSGFNLATSSCVTSLPFSKSFIDPDSSAFKRRRKLANSSSGCIVTSPIALRSAKHRGDFKTDPLPSALHRQERAVIIIDRLPTGWQSHSVADISVVADCARRYVPNPCCSLPPEGVLMRCSKCRHENRTGAKFCEECEVEVPRIPGAFLRGEQFYTDAIGR